MKICFIAPKAYQLFNSEVKSTFGGAEVQLFLLAKELAKKKELDIHFMVADYEQKEIEEHSGVTVHKSLNFGSSKVRQIRDFFRVFDKINADIYIQRTLTAESGLIALYCRLKKKKFVYMVAHDRETDGGHVIYRSLFGSFLAHLVFKLTDKVIVQNQYQKENLLKIKKRKSVLLNSSCKINEGNSNEKEFILWVGRSEDWKRPDLFLELIGRLQSEKFVMICPPATENSELAEIIKRRAENFLNLTFLEFVTFVEIDKYFQKAKIFVNTSMQEGFPNTFLQSMKSKTPILSLNVNPNNILDDNQCGLSCHDKYDLLRKNMKKLLENDILRAKMGENGFYYAKENHDIKNNATKFLKILNDEK